MIYVGTYIMRIIFAVIVGLLMLIVRISFSYMLIPEEQGIAIINQPLFAQLGIPSDTIVLNNNTNVTTQIAPTITENNTTTIITPAPEVNDTLIGRSTPTASNSTLEIDGEVNNKTGEAEPLGGIE